MRGLKQERWFRNAGVNVVLTKYRKNAINGEQKDSVREEIVAVSSTTNRDAISGICARLCTSKLKNNTASGKMARLPCKDHLKGPCTTPFCEKWQPPECLFYKSEHGCRFGEKCSYAHRQVDEQPSKKSEKNGDKSAVAMLKSTRQLGCVFQDMEPPKSTTLWRKSS